MVLLSRVSAGLASSYTFVNPVIALALGIWLGGETVTLFEWVAAAVITGGVVLLVLGRQPQSHAPKDSAPPETSSIGKDPLRNV
jgi:drug/metabolite transporter (DMT)-like permease